MLDFTIFVVFLIAGWLLRYSVSIHWSTKLKDIAYYSLLTFVVISLWLYGFPSQSWELVMLGALLQLVPSMIGALLSDRYYRKEFLLFSTFGGGNRGTLALSLLAPTLLPVFVLMDLGNFLSLILFYPFLIRWKIKQKEIANENNSEIISLFVTLLILMIGLLLNNINIEASHGIKENIHYTIKFLLIALTSFQIGLHLKINKTCLRWTFNGLIKVRLISLVIPLLLASWLVPDALSEAIPVLLLFSILPVSSLVVSLLPKETDRLFQQQLACAVTASTAIFLTILVTIVMVRNFL